MPITLTSKNPIVLDSRTVETDKLRLNFNNVNNYFIDNNDLSFTFSFSAYNDTSEIKLNNIDIIYFREDLNSELGLDESNYSYDLSHSEMLTVVEAIINSNPLEFYNLTYSDFDVVV